MTVYFYHTQDIQFLLGKIAAGTCPPHLLYGATKLPSLGINVVWHKSHLGLNRLLLMVDTAWKVLTCRQHYDAIYATHYRGLELIIFLRAMHLFRKPIIVWHHQPVITSPSSIREHVGRLFYKGFDHLIFFSDALRDTSLRTKKVCPERMTVVPWGMDLPSWHIAPARHERDKLVFVSSGKELRDLPTLLAAFNATGERLELFICERNGEMDYGTVLRTTPLKDNISIHMQTQLAPYEISQQVARADVVCICCLPAKYTVGLTTLVEALALGKAIITTKNSNYPLSVSHEGCGIEVDYYDIAGWHRAITYCATHKDEVRAMGLRARALAATRFNDRLCAHTIARIITTTLSTDEGIRRSHCPKCQPR